MSVNADTGKTEGLMIDSVQEVTNASSSQTQTEDIERKARVDAVWQQMNKGVSTKTLKSILNKPSLTVDRMQKTSSNNSQTWMTVLGLAPKKTTSLGPDMQKQPTTTQNGTSEGLKRLAAAALLAVKDASIAAVGKVEITEVRDFAGEEIEVKKFVDANTKEALEKAKASAGPYSAVDSVLEQIKKKPKLSVLDKTKMDWGEFKEENKGLEEELDVYKKSSNQYLDRVSFLQRTDYREFERERDARLALHAKRKPDMGEDF